MRQSKRWKDVNDCLGLIGALVELKQDLQLHPQRIYRDVNGKIKDDSLYKKGSLGLIVAIYRTWRWRRSSQSTKRTNQNEY